MENFFFDTDEDKNSIDERFYVLVIYDIIDNKKRSKLANIMKSFGFRVQKSAFEARLEEKKYVKLLSKIQPLIDDNDSVRIYKIRGQGAVTVFGKSSLDENEDVIII